jgi:predicted CoA-binding protein
MQAESECEIPAKNLSDVEARRLMGRGTTIAVVGCSTNPDKPAHFVPKYLQEHGYTIIPVNPTAKGEILGKTVYPSLRAVPVPVDIVDIFRPAADVPPIVEDAIAIKAKAIWMQEGIVHNAAADRARAAGLQVVMNKCLKKVHGSQPAAE